jgi:hypothetical protein
MDFLDADLSENWQDDCRPLVVSGFSVLVEGFVVFFDEAGAEVFESVGFFADVGDGSRDDGSAE